MSIQETLKKRILVIDGAMGTMIQRHKLTEADYRGTRFADWPSDLKGNNDLLCITQPAIVTGIHLQYLEAGADIVETNTFSSTSIAMADYDMQSLAYELNVAAAKCAKEAIKQYKSKHPNATEKYIAGAIGPLNKTLSLSPDVNNPGFRAVTFDEVVLAYTEQIRGLVDGGVDIILIETVGVGQSEVEIAGLADTTVVVLVPEAGDEVQMMKSGLMEIAQVFVVNKSDRPDAEAFTNHLLHMMREGLGDAHSIPVVKTIASQQLGIDELVAAIAAQHSNGLSTTRKKQLLISKLYQIITAHQMRSLNGPMIEAELATSMQQKHFNIFKFANKFFNV